MYSRVMGGGGSAGGVGRGGADGGGCGDATTISLIVSLFL